MDTALSSMLSTEPKRVSLEEIKAVHKRMLNIVESDKKLDTEMQLTPVPSNWDNLWESRYNELAKLLNKMSPEFSNVLELEEEADEDMVRLIEDYESLPENYQDMRAALENNLSILETASEAKKNDIRNFEKFLNVEAKRINILSEKAALSAQIRDLLVAELKSEQILDLEQEPMRRSMISDMAKWWDCLLYNMSIEMNQSLEDHKIGKWSELYLQWCIGADLKAAGCQDPSDDEDSA